MMIHLPRDQAIAAARGMLAMRAGDALWCQRAMLN
jgi:hypothetical protein